MGRILFILTAFLFCASFIQKPKRFPEIHYVTNQGNTFSNEDFMGNRTVVVLFHLGCPAAMSLLKDIERLSLDKNDSVQIIGILENTPEQIKQFNSSQKNLWSDTRNLFHLEPVKIPLVGECTSENVTINENGDSMIGVQCEILSKKIKTKYSPTLVFVDHHGDIIKIKKGYISAPSVETRKEYLLNY